MSDKPFREGYVWNTKTVNEALKMLEAGIPKRTVAKHFNSSPTAMRNGLIRYGLYRPKLSYQQALARIKQLEAALDIIAGNNGLALRWMSTAPMPMEKYEENCNEMMRIARAALGEKKDV
jgi:hypothetical protein